SSGPASAHHAPRGGRRRVCHTCCTIHTAAAPASTAPGARHSPASTPATPHHSQRRRCRQRKYHAVTSKYRLSVLGSAKKKLPGKAARKSIVRLAADLP